MRESTKSRRRSASAASSAVSNRAVRQRRTEVFIEARCSIDAHRRHRRKHTDPGRSRATASSAADPEAGWPGHGKPRTKLGKSSVWRSFRSLVVDRRGAQVVQRSYRCAVGAIFAIGRVECRPTARSRSSTSSASRGRRMAKALVCSPPSWRGDVQGEGRMVSKRSRASSATTRSPRCRLPRDSVLPKPRSRRLQAPRARARRRPRRLGWSRLVTF